MRKTKLLMPLTGVAAIGVVAPTILTTTSCSQTKIEDLIITIKVDNVFVGTKINRDQVKVDVKMSDGSIKEDVKTWTCNKFDADGNYTFSKAGEVQLTFVYEKFEKVQKFNAEAITDAQFISKNYTINITPDKTTSTSAKLSLISKGQIMVLEPTLFDWKVEKSDVLRVDSETGIVTALAPGESKVIVAFKDDETSTPMECTVTVVESAITFDAEQDLLTVDNVLATGEIYTVPRIVTTSTGSHTVKYVQGSNAAATSIKTLILPATLRGIADSTFASCTLQNIYYNGSEDDWDYYMANERDGTWAGNATIGVQSNTGSMILFDYRYDTIVKDASEGVTVGKYLALKNTIGAFRPRTYTVQFDYSELNLNSVQDALKVQIMAYKEHLFRKDTLVNLNDIIVYIDGVKAGEGADYTYTDKVLSFVNGGRLTKDSLVVVTFTTERFEILSNIHLAAAHLVEE